MNNTIVDEKMATQTTVTFRTSPEIKARLEKLATTMRRSKSFLTNTAVEQFLAEEEAFVADVEAGKRDLEAGRALSTDELTASLHNHIDQISGSKSA